MSENFNNIAVLGASGTVGSAVVSALLEANFNVTVLTRPTSSSSSPSSTSTFPESVTVVQVDYTDLAKLTSTFTGQDAVVSTVAPFGVLNQQVAIDAAVQARVKRFIPSEFGLDTSLPNVAEIAPFAVNKQKIAKYLQSKESAGLTWTSICSSAFFPWQLELGSGKMGWDIRSRRATLYDDGTRPYDATTVAQVARAVVAVLRRPLPTANQYVYVKSFTLTQRRVLASLERHPSSSSSSSPVSYTVTHASALDSRREGMALVDRGDLQAGYPKITAGAAFGPEGMGSLGGKEGRWMEALGLVESGEEEFEELVRGAVERMTAETPAAG